MSTRVYPLWKPGAPQLRIFLPNFLMKLIKPPIPMPKHMAQFEIDMKMTNVDVKNYLEKIYDVPVRHVGTKVIRGERFKYPASGSDADHFRPDIKYAFVSLDKSVDFTFPSLKNEAVEKANAKELEMFDDNTNRLRQQRQVHWDRAGAPSWFSY